MLLVFRVQRERQTWSLRNLGGKYIGSEKIGILMTVQSSRRTCGCALSVLVDTYAIFVLSDLRIREKEREGTDIVCQVLGFTDLNGDDIGPMHMYRFSSNFDRECPGSESETRHLQTTWAVRCFSRHIGDICPFSLGLG